MGFILALAQFLHLFARGINAQLLRVNLEAKLLRNLIFQRVKLLALELDDLVTVIANDVIVIRMIGVIGVVDFVVLAEIHLVHHPALGEQRQGAIDCGAGHARVAFAGPLEKLLRVEMLVGAEHRVDNRPALRGDPQIFMYQKSNKLFLRLRSIDHGHEVEA